MIGNWYDDGPTWSEAERLAHQNRNDAARIEAEIINLVRQGLPCSEKLKELDAIRAKIDEAPATR